MAVCRSRVDAIQAAIAAELETQRPGLDRLTDLASVHLIAVLHPRTGRVIRILCRPEVQHDLTQSQAAC
jgi:hypothetical protein